MEMVTGENDKGRRLDRILRKSLPDYPLPLLHRLLRQGKVLVDGKKAKADDRIGSGVKISIPSLEKDLTQRHKDAKKREKTEHITYIPDILWQDMGLLALNKPAGLAIHGKDSLDTLVRSYLADKLPPSLSFKPGPLHRLDKMTSGIVIFSTNLEGARLFTSLLRDRKVKKTYLAVVEGAVEKEEIWEDFLVRDKELKKTFIEEEIEKSSRRDTETQRTQRILKREKKAKNAITRVKPLAVKDGLTMIAAEIETGRTHQIRAQAAFHGHPLAEDKKYSGRGSGNFFLHAWKLEFLDICLEAPPPSGNASSSLFLNINL
jgi:23S rRNA pseudouridine955/2504/2580 synthase